MELCKVGLVFQFEESRAELDRLTFEEFWNVNVSDTAEQLF